MKDVIIFGCGDYGKQTYELFKEKFNVVAFVDNRESLWGTKLLGIDIISPKELLLKINAEEIILLVAVAKSQGIIKQLKEMGLEDFYVWKTGFLYINVKTNSFLELDIPVLELDDPDKSILFVRRNIAGGIREYRLAKVLKEAGYKVYLALIPPLGDLNRAGFNSVYERIIPVLSLKGLMDFINRTPFRQVHSASEPEWLTSLIINCNKPVTYECHDLGSINGYMSNEGMALEYIANSKTKGAVYPSKRIMDIAVRKHKTSQPLVVENLILDSFITEKKREKLSKQDGKMHIVYEGAISAAGGKDKRNFEEIWEKIADEGIHIHFYTGYSEDYCKRLESMHKNIHYEGNLSSSELAYEMSQYDLGLMIFNINIKTKFYIECASPNKMYEYLNAGIPVASSKIETARDFLEKYSVGGEIDVEMPIYPQLERISKLVVPDDFLTKNRLTIETNADKIIEFFENTYEETL